MSGSNRHSIQLDSSPHPCHTFRMTDPRDQRINARIDEELQRKLSYLRRRTNQSTTGVLREAIERYHAQMGKADATCAEILEQTGFIGCAAGARGLSARYKEELVSSLAKKT